MKEKFENIKLFIAEHKAYFKENIEPDVSFGWADNSWNVSSTHQGVFSGRSSGHLEFKKINMLKKGVYLDEEITIDEKHEINLDYRDFMKAFVVFIIKINNNKISISALHRDTLLLKRIYVRMLINGNQTPTAYNINDDVISKTMLAHCSAMANKNNAADSQTAMRKICEYITRLAITLNPLTFVVTQKRPSSKSTEAAKQAKIKAFHNSEFAEENDEDDSQKLITIQTFLNIVAVRSMVTSDGEKILLNMLMLLMITGFRFGELERLKVDSLKKMEVEDAEAVSILKRKGLKPYYLGITYVGEKKAGHRTHWVEPLAIDLVELIFKDTLKLTMPVREHIKECRLSNFKTLMPMQLRNKLEISLDEVVTHIMESFSKSSKQRGAASQRDYTKKALSQLNTAPFRVDTINGRQKSCYYSLDSLELFLRKKISTTKILNEKFIYRFIDSRTGSQETYNIEDLLFIAPVGSTSLARTSVVKILPVPVTLTEMLKFVGANDGQGGVSLFSKYNLIDESGNFPVLTTHMPRHTINTFLAIAGITDHLQAVMMGRVDISQNEAYHHLAIEQRALASDVVSPLAQSHMLPIVDDKQQIITATNALDIIKQSGQISISPELSLDNAFAQNTHTFTTHEEKMSFISDVFETHSLDLMAGLALASADQSSMAERNALLHRHSDLHPLDFGSCMRKLQAWSCPYSMKCQDGTPCPYFTVIGRADDTVKLTKKLSALQQQLDDVRQLLITGALTQEEYDEIVGDVFCRQNNLQRIKEDSLKIDATKRLVNLIRFDEQRKPKTLATIFAVEHKKLENN